MTLARPIWVFFFLFLASCAQLGVESPKTFNEKIAVAISTVTAIRQTATTLLVAKKITPEDAQNVQTQADNARAGVEVARMAGSPAGEAKIQQVQLVLQALQAYLAAKEK